MIDCTKSFILLNSSPSLDSYAIDIFSSVLEARKSAQPVFKHDLNAVKAIKYVSQRSKSAFNCLMNENFSDSLTRTTNVLREVLREIAYKL